MKSHPLTFAIKPLTKKDAASYESYLLQKSEYDLWLETPKKERDNDVSKPFLKKNIVQDFTPESLQAVHHDNQRGLGAYNDELMAWVNNFGRYSGGVKNNFGCRIGREHLRIFPEKTIVLELIILLSQ
jgi:hypothetical protein